MAGGMKRRGGRGVDEDDISPLPALTQSRGLGGSVEGEDPLDVVPARPNKQVENEGDPAFTPGSHAVQGPGAASWGSHDATSSASSDYYGSEHRPFVVDTKSTPIAAEVVEDEADIESRVNERVRQESEEIARRIRKELAQSVGAANVASNHQTKHGDEDDDTWCGCNKWVTIGVATAIILVGGGAAIAAAIVLTSGSPEPSPPTPPSGAPTIQQTCTLCADGTVPGGLEEKFLTEPGERSTEGISCAEFALSFRSIDAVDGECASNQAFAWVSCGCPTLPPPVEDPSCTLCEGGAFVDGNAAACEDFQTYAGLVSASFPLLSCDSYRETAAGCECPEGVLGVSEADRRIEAFTEALTTVSGDLLQDPSTNQYRALNWLATEDEMALPIDTPFESLAQRYVAALFFYETGGDEGEANRWTLPLKFLSGENECDWNDGAIGLGCNDQDELTVIRIGDNGLSGVIPDEIGSLSTLGQLELDDNVISSTIPASLFTIPTLDRVWIDNNTLTGALPLTLSGAVSLTSLSLFTNRLQGPIPDISALNKLDYIGLGSNMLSGPLPSFETIPGIRFIWLYQNRFIGQTIPPSIGQLTRLSNLALYDCGLKGPIPSFSNNAGYLELLYLFNNSLTGNLSAIMDDLASIEYGVDVHTDGLVELEINRNDLFGTIPKTIAQLTAVQEIWMGTNPRVEGTVPSEIGLLDGKLSHLNLGETNLTGTIPTEIGLLTALTELGFYDCDLSGAIPSEIGQLGMVRFLDLQQQRLTGTIPGTVAGLSSIVGLGLADNQLVGTVPESLNHPELEIFYLQKNDFVALPPAFCSRSNPIDSFIADCGGAAPELSCACCSECCVDGSENCSTVN